MRGLLYLLARWLGDVNAVRRGRLHKRIVNRWVGRTVVRRMWWR